MVDMHWPWTGEIPESVLVERRVMRLSKVERPPEVTAGEAFTVAIEFELLERIVGTYGFAVYFYPLALALDKQKRQRFGTFHRFFLSDAWKVGEIVRIQDIIILVPENQESGDYGLRLGMDWNDTSLWKLRKEPPANYRWLFVNEDLDKEQTIATVRVSDSSMKYG